MEMFQFQSVKMSPECTGPISFVVEWTCAGCGHRNTLQKKMSLLAPEPVECSECGARGTYTYPENFFKKLSGKLKEISSMESALHGELRRRDDPLVSMLGNNFNFVLSSLIYNIAAGDGT